jgi:hypothetical protein
MIGAVPLLSLYAFMAWRGTTLLYNWGNGATVVFIAPETLNDLEYHLINLLIAKYKVKLH